MSKRAGVGLMAVVVLASVMVILKASFLEAQMEQAAPAPVEVQVKMVEGRIVASPDPAEVRLGETLRWTVDCQKDDQISVEFDAQKGVPGPFAPVGETAIRGKYSAIGQSSIDIDTGTADQLPVDAMGKSVEYQDWKYSISWRSGTKTIQVDPIVRVRGGGPG